MDVAADRRLDCVVIGAGPAGLTAALYLQRYRRPMCIVDSGHSRALCIERTRNYPGFPGGIAGHELLARLREQLAEAGGEVLAGEAGALQRDDEGFRLQLDGRALCTRTVLLATGVVDVVPPLPGMAEVQRAGLLRQCPICDGPEHRDRRIAVVGDGAHAQRELRFVTQFSAHAVGVGVAAVPGPVAGARTLPAPAVRVELTGPEGGVRLHLQDGRTHHCDILYAAMGVRPRVQLAQALGAQLDTLDNVVVDAHGRSSVPGLYAAGDIVGGLDQLAVAVGQGAVAATAIHNALPLRPRAPAVRALRPGVTAAALGTASKD